VIDKCLMNTGGCGIDEICNMDASSVV